MNRLIFALALIPALMTSTAFAQSVGDDVTKELWCGTALVVAFSNPPADVTSEQMAQAQTYIDGGNALIDDAAQKHLDAGFTQDQVTKIKADLVAEVTPIVTGTGDASKAKFTFDDCAQLLPTAAGSSEAPADTTTSSSAP